MSKKIRKFKKLASKIEKVLFDKIGVSVLILTTFFSLNFPQHSIAIARDANNGTNEVIITSQDANDVDEYSMSTSNDPQLPKFEEKDPRKTMYVYATAYNSLPSQTDGDPCTTANGFDLCELGVEDTIATNFLPFGTKIRIPDYFGDRVFTVRDRMNSRYSDKIDIWMQSYDSAKQFGRRYVKIEIY